MDNLKPGDPCYVGGGGFRSHYIKYYSYTINDDHYFANNKSDAITMSRNIETGMTSKRGQKWNNFKKM